MKDDFKMAFKSKDHRDAILKKCRVIVPSTKKEKPAQVKRIPGELLPQLVRPHLIWRNKQNKRKFKKMST
jgi:hypothetical protein